MQHTSKVVIQVTSTILMYVVASIVPISANTSKVENLHHGKYMQKGQAILKFRFISKHPSYPKTKNLTLASPGNIVFSHFPHPASY